MTSSQLGTLRRAGFLEELAYDPESMPPPPGAKGLHPLDDHGSPVGDDVLPAAPTPEADIAGQPESDIGAHPEPDVAAQPEPESQVPQSQRPESQRPVAAPTAPPTSSSADADDDHDDHDDEPPRKAATGSARKPARRSVPSWDDVMFGAKPRD